VAAVRAVRDSAALDGVDAVSPLAVLIQPQPAAEHGGVLFGADPVEGDDGHLVVELAPGNPSALVGGEVTARHLVCPGAGAGSRRSVTARHPGAGSAGPWRSSRHAWTACSTAPRTSSGRSPGTACGCCRAARSPRSPSARPRADPRVRSRGRHVPRAARATRERGVAGAAAAGHRARLEGNRRGVRPAAGRVARCGRDRRLAGGRPRAAGRPPAAGARVQSARRHAAAAGRLAGRPPPGRAPRAGVGPGGPGRP
jgi:hypothetical protein